VTDQVSEILIVQGEELWMCTDPLETYFVSAGIKSPFKWQETCCWRGYVGTWEIENDRLYLDSVEGRTAHGTPIGLTHLFPGKGERVFAHWYSGEIRCPAGKLLEARIVGWPWPNLYERDRFFTIKEGVVTGQRIVTNDLPKNTDDVPKSKNWLEPFSKILRRHGILFSYGLLF
jgi:hypothetical protein